MMRSKLAVLLVVLPFLLSAQSVDSYCRYFNLSVSHSEGTPATIYAMPALRPAEDALGRFIQAHHFRYDYLLINKTGNLAAYNKLLPDSLGAQDFFCRELQQNRLFDQYFKQLTRLDRKQKPELSWFTQEELMRVASRFFMCDEVRMKDTTIGAHICIGLNGQKELKTQRDYSVLEAFCYEAIFVHLSAADESVVYDNFIAAIGTETQKARLQYTDSAAFLDQVKMACYARMEQDTVLKGVLLRHYRANKGNMNIAIR